MTSYSYDPISRLASLSHDLAGSSYDVTTTFSYNPASQLTSSTRTNDAYAWNGAVTVNRGYGSNGLNQLTYSGATSLAYDARGNLTNSGSDTYAYSSENRLSQASNGTLIPYEPAYGQMLELYQSGLDMRFSWWGGTMTGEINAATWTYSRRYVPGPGSDEPVVWYEGSGTSDRRWLHADERGSIVAVTDGSGNALAINTYDEHGIPGASNMGRFQYTGQAWLPELGMYYYKARMYSPTLGRFMQTDPIGYGDGMNMYRYVHGDPVNWVDPTGMFGGWDCHQTWSQNFIEATDEPAGGIYDFQESCKWQSFGSGGTNGYTPPTSNGGGGGGPQREQRCAASGITVNRAGNRILISTSLRGRNLTTAQMQRAADAINRRWSGQIGPYSVSTHVTVDMVGGRVLLTGDSRSALAVTPTFMGNTYNEVRGLNPTLASYGSVAAHEFGHLLGLPDRYTLTPTGPVVDPGYDGNIMGDATGRVSARDIRNSIENAGRC